MKKGFVTFQYVLLAIYFALLSMFLLIQPIYAQAEGEAVPTPQVAVDANATPTTDGTTNAPISETLTSTLVSLDTPGLVVEAPIVTPGQSTDAAVRTTLFFPLINR